jgi:hypothetical protein
MSAAIRSGSTHGGVCPTPDSSVVLLMVGGGGGATRASSSPKNRFPAQSLDVALEHEPAAQVELVGHLAEVGCSSGCLAKVERQSGFGANENEYRWLCTSTAAPG